MTRPLSEQETALPDDAFDALAKDLINRFCNNANQFLRAKVMQEHIHNPLEGFRVPFKPLADKMRETAKQAYATNLPPAATSNNWFADDAGAPAEQPVAVAPVAVVQPPAPPPVTDFGTSETEGGGESVSLDAIVKAMGGKATRLNELAAALNISPETLGRVIAAPHSGLYISGPGWVKIREAGD